MEFCNFLYHLQQAHISAVRCIISATENKTAQIDRGTMCVLTCVYIDETLMRTRKKSAHLFCVSVLQTQTLKIQVCESAKFEFRLHPCSPTLQHILEPAGPDDITSSSGCNDTVTCVKPAFTLPITDTRTPWTSAASKDSKSGKKSVRKSLYPLIWWPAAAVKNLFDVKTVRELYNISHTVHMCQPQHFYSYFYVYEI